MTRREPGFAFRRLNQPRDLLSGDRSQQGGQAVPGDLNQMRSEDNLDSWSCHLRRRQPVTRQRHARSGEAGRLMSGRGALLRSKCQSSDVNSDAGAVANDMVHVILLKLLFLGFPLRFVRLVHPVQIVLVDGLAKFQLGAMRPAPIRWPTADRQIRQWTPAAPGCRW